MSFRHKLLAKLTVFQHLIPRGSHFGDDVLSCPVLCYGCRNRPRHPKIGAKLRASSCLVLGLANMYCEATSAQEPPVTCVAVYCSFLLANELHPLLGTLVPLLISFSAEGPLARVTRDGVALWCCLMHYMGGACKFQSSVANSFPVTSRRRSCLVPFFLGHTNSL